MTEPADQPQPPQLLELAIPFTATASHGGPYDDHAFVAGYQAGQISRSLAAAAAVDATELRFTVYADLVKQLDLVAMHHGYTLDAKRLDEIDEWSGGGFGEWAFVTFTRSGAKPDTHREAAP